MPPRDLNSLARWVELYGDPEDWAKRAQDAHAKAERAEARCDVLADIIVRASLMCEQRDPAMVQQILQEIRDVA